MYNHICGDCNDILNNACTKRILDEQAIMFGIYIIQIPVIKSKAT